MTVSKKSVYDCKHVRSVKAWAITFGGEFAGRVVANYSDNPMGAVVTVGVAVWLGPLKHTDGPMLGKAGGYGYCKFSAAFDAAIRKPAEASGVFFSSLSGRGESEVRSFLEDLGYKVMEVI